MKYAFFVLFLVGLGACSHPKEETVDLDDLAPVSERYKEGVNEENPETVVIKDQRPDQSPFLAVIDTLMKESRWIKWDTLLFPDRFGPKSAEKWQVLGGNDSLVLLNYTFKDSLRTKNAFFNWIDCFGPKCSSYVIGGNLRIRNRNGLILVGEKQLFFFESGKALDEKKIRMQLQKDPEKENWIYLIRIPKTGKTSWKRIEKGEEQPIIRTDENS